MSSEQDVICVTCETSAHVTTTIERQAIPYGTEGLSFTATFPAHHCSGCGESFLSESGMLARHKAQREFEATLRR